MFNKKSTETNVDINTLRSLAGLDIRKIKESGVYISDDTISPNETMKWNGGVENYFYHGKSAINLIDATLKLLFRDKSDIKSILDFPCGYGRVLRFLKGHFSESDIYACDLNKGGVEFCSSTLGAHGVLSDTNLSKVNFDTKFDLIWCGSLLTHINSKQWPAFFHFFDRVLNDQGLLIFTYAGEFVKELVNQGDHNFIDDREAKKALHDYQKKGFGFMQYNTHKYEYGRTICSTSWIREFIDNNCANYRGVLHFERGWSGRQDVIALVKET